MNQAQLEGSAGVWRRTPALRVLRGRALLLTVASCISSLTPASGVAQDPVPYTTWQVAGGDPGVSRYSKLSQINRDNVGRLEIAWTYRSGDSWSGSTIQANPIVVRGILYATSPSLHAVALDAATGHEIWRFDPFDGERGGGTNRGVTYWEDREDRRILFSAGHYLYALDARTGAPLEEFGEGGRVDLRQNLGRDPAEISIAAPAPGVLYKDLIILGSMGDAPGHVRAYDVRSGKMRWIFHTIPHPGEPFYETWGKDSWKTSTGANVWGGMSVDPERGMVFFATGSPKPNYHGWLHPGRNLYANSVVALDASTGEYIWHFQEIRHDIWDLDLPAPPNLVTVKRQGQEIPAVAQVSKTGNTYLLHRLTGEPLFPIEELSAPSSDIPIEEAWPSQPRPLKPPPFSRQVVTEEELTTLSPEAHADALERFRTSRSGWFMPVSPRGTIYYGIHGGAEWSGASFDPTTGVLYVNANNVPWIITIEEIAPSDESASGRVAAGEQLYGQSCLVCHGAGKQGSSPAPALQDIAARSTSDQVESIIRGGRGSMPSFGHLSAEEMDALLAYLGYRSAADPGMDAPASEDTASPRYRFTGFKRFLDPEGYPAGKPPWGTLNAIDLNAGTILWQVPLGEHPELTSRGHPQTGTENFGGSIVTAGGLVVIAATKDEKLRAFDSATGWLLWETQLPAGGYATPSTYEVGGKQFLVIAAGGGGKLGTLSGDYYIAFALPDP